MRSFRGTYEGTIEVEVTNGDDVDYQEVDVRVKDCAVPECRGAREYGGVQIEPDEPAHIEIEECFLEEDGRPWELTTAQEEQFEREIALHLHGLEQAAQEDRWEARRENRANP